MDIVQKACTQNTHSSYNFHLIELTSEAHSMVLTCTPFPGEQTGAAVCAWTLLGSGCGWEVVYPLTEAPGVTEEHCPLSRGRLTPLRVHWHVF